MRAKCARVKEERARNAMAWNVMTWWAVKRVGVLREAATKPVGRGVMGAKFYTGSIERVLGGVRRRDFFWSGKYLGSASAAPTKIPLLRVRFQRATGLGRGISRSAPPEAICVLPSGTAGSIACFFL
jgi:hypothetical protein